MSPVRAYFWADGFQYLKKGLQSNFCITNHNSLNVQFDYWKRGCQIETPKEEIISHIRPGQGKKTKPIAIHNYTNKFYIRQKQMKCIIFHEERDMCFPC